MDAAVAVLAGEVLEPGLYDRGLARYAPALDLLAQGRSLDVAAEAVGVHPRNLFAVLKKNPTVLAELKQNTEALRLVVYQRSIALMQARLDRASEDPTNVKLLSNRDLTDFVRSIKPEQEKLVGDVTIKNVWLSNG